MILEVDRQRVTTAEEAATALGAPRSGGHLVRIRGASGTRFITLGGAPEPARPDSGGRGAGTAGGADPGGGGAARRRSTRRRGAAIATLMPDPGGVIAFGELHQTRATAKVRSAIARFTDEILPVVAPHASHLIVETWITRGTCGEAEAHVTEEVARTTERPVETESEIMKLLRRAKELGVAPHVLDVGCDEYEVLAGDVERPARRLRQAADHHQPAPGAGDRAGAAAAARAGAAAGRRLRRGAAQRSVPRSDAGEVHVRAPRARGHARRLPRGRSLRARDGRHDAGAEGGAVVPRLAARGCGRQRRRHRSATRARPSWFSGAARAEVDCRARCARGRSPTFSRLLAVVLASRRRLRRRRRPGGLPGCGGAGGALAGRRRDRAEPVGRRGEQRPGLHIAVGRTAASCRWARAG